MNPYNEGSTENIANRTFNHGSSLKQSRRAVTRLMEELSNSRNSSTIKERREGAIGGLLDQFKNSFSR